MCNKRLAAVTEVVTSGAVGSPKGAMSGQRLRDRWKCLMWEVADLALGRLVVARSTLSILR